MRPFATTQNPETAFPTVRPHEAMVAAVAGPLAVQAEVPEISAFHTTETLRDRAARYLYNLTGFGNFRTKPFNYDVAQYQNHWADVVAETVERNGGELQPALYGAAYEAAIVLADVPEGMHAQDYHHDTARGAEGLGVARAVAHNPAFATTDPARAAGFLTRLGEHEYGVGHDMFTRDNWRTFESELNPAAGEDPLPAMQALAQEDEMWATTTDQFGHEQLNAKWTLSSLAEGLGILSRTRVMDTIDLRLDMLAKNRSSADEATIYRHLVYTFNTDYERQALRVRLADQNTPAVTRGVIADVLGNRWSGTYWAI